MRDGIPFKSRPSLQWQIVLVNPMLLRQAQRRLRVSGPSEAIEHALEIALGHRQPALRSPRSPTPLQ